jgi:hypothetical protein
MPSGTSLVGRTFGSLAVSCETAEDIYLCRCNCGTEVRLWRSQLTKGVARDCGCKSGRPGRAAFRHIRIYFGRDGRRHQRATSELLSYCAMKGRCLLKNNISYENYGGRNIQICERWLLPHGEGFRNFLRDLGPRPVGTTLDRTDPNGHYLPPPQCRWATPEVQANNKRQGDEPLVRDIAEVEEMF